MRQQNLSNSLSKLSLLSERYESIAQKEKHDQAELENAKIEMRIIKEEMLTTIIEAKKNLKNIEEKAKLH